MEVKSLSDLASFSVAKFAWNYYVDDKLPEICSELFRDVPTYNWKEVYEIEELVEKLYPNLPACILGNIRYFLVHIDKELSRWKSHLPEVIPEFSSISWTPLFTIDRVRTRCISKKFDINDLLLCPCCELRYVFGYLSNFALHDQRTLKFIFGDYVGHAILYWYWYGRYNRSFLSHVWKYYRYYQKGKPIENIFKIAAFLEYETGVMHYWSKMTEEQRLSYDNLIIPLMLVESDYLPFIPFNGLLPSYTFNFLWLRLDDIQQWEIVQYYFLDFSRYLLYHENGVDVLSFYLERWNPFLAPIEYYQVLRMSIDTDNLEFYKLLWKKKIIPLPFETIGHLLCTLMCGKDDDYEMCVMMINDYAAEETKIEILKELDKRIECIRLDPNIIDEFLLSADLIELRNSAFPRNPLYKTIRGWLGYRYDKS